MLIKELSLGINGSLRAISPHEKKYLGRVPFAFTLIELLLVLTITLLLATLSIPSFFSSTEQEIVKELDKLEAIIVYLQQQAVATQKTHMIFFDQNQQGYLFDKNGKNVTFSFGNNICFGFLPTAYGPPGDPTAPIKQCIAFPINEKNIFFAKLFPNGKISPGSLYITDKYKKHMGALTCSVSQVSYIRKYVYQSDKWVPL